jgi:hypothetical protein
MRPGRKRMGDWELIRVGSYELSEDILGFTMKR